MVVLRVDGVDLVRLAFDEMIGEVVWTVFEGEVDFV